MLITGLPAQGVALRLTATRQVRLRVHQRLSSYGGRRAAAEAHCAARLPACSGAGSSCGQESSEGYNSDSSPSSDAVGSSSSNCTPARPRAPHPAGALAAGPWRSTRARSSFWRRRSACCPSAGCARSGSCMPSTAFLTLPQSPAAHLHQPQKPRPYFSRRQHKPGPATLPPARPVTGGVRSYALSPMLQSCRCCTCCVRQHLVYAQQVFSMFTCVWCMLTHTLCDVTPLGPLGMECSNQCAFGTYSVHAQPFKAALAPHATAQYL